MRVFKSLVRKNRIWVLLSLAAMLLSVGTELVWSTGIGNLADRIEGREGVPQNLLFTMGGLLAAVALTAYVNQLVNRYTAERMGNSLRMGFADSVLGRGCRDGYETAGSFEVMSQVQNELMQASDYMTGTLANIVRQILSALIILVFFFAKNVILTLVLLLPMVITAVIVRLMGKRLVPLVNGAMNEKVVHNKVAYSAITNAEAVYAFDGQSFFKERYRDNLKNWGRIETRKERMNALCNSLSGILSQVPLLLVFTVGALMIWKGQITFGTLIIFLNMQKGVLRTLMNLPTWMISVKGFLVHLNRVEGSYEE